MRANTLKIINIFAVVLGISLGGSAFGQNILGSAPTANSKYGALAYNHNSGSWGWAVDYANKTAAANRALSECGAGCQVVLSFWNTCAAFAKGSTSKGWAIGSSRIDAENKAESACNEESDDYDCVVKVWGCTNR